MYIKNIKANLVLNENVYKEFRLPSGKKIDFIDFNTKTIYELKPNNYFSIKQGNKQLNLYLKEVESIYGEGWNVVLDKY